LFDHEILSIPTDLALIERDTADLGFGMASDRQTGSLLRSLAASKPGGSLLELGTGTGLSAAWILDGMDAGSTLTTVDNNPTVVEVARRRLSSDMRVTFHVSDGSAFLDAMLGRTFDLIFADTWPGKYDHLEEALALLKPGGFYIIDDLLPQPNWPPSHAEKVPVLISALAAREDLVLTKLGWSTGLIVAVKRERDTGDGAET
jgi:predicted O-methyltransferase YrrM